MCFKLAKFFELFFDFHFMQKIEFFTSHDPIPLSLSPTLGAAFIITCLHSVLHFQISQLD